MKSILTEATIYNPDHPLFNHKVFLLFSVQDFIIYSHCDHVYCEERSNLHLTGYNEHDLIEEAQVLDIFTSAVSSNYNFQNSLKYPLENLLDNKILNSARMVADEQIRNSYHSDLKQEISHELQNKLNEEFDSYVAEWGVKMREELRAQVKAEIFIDLKKELDQKMQDFNDRERSIFLDSLQEL